MRAAQWFMLGFDDLVPVVPPGAQLARGSRISAEACGKAPGIRYRSGRWGGYSWIDQETTTEFVSIIDQSDANIGLRAARYPAVDIDIRDEGLAAAVGKMVEEITGAKHYRVGLPPRQLYPLRLSGPPFRGPVEVVPALPTVANPLAEETPPATTGVQPTIRRHGGAESVRLLCQKCRESSDADELHDRPGVGFNEPWKRFRKDGCAVFGARHSDPNPDAEAFRVVYDLMPNDPDGCASFFEDLRG